MKIFARPEILGGNNDVDKQLVKVPKHSLSKLCSIYREMFSFTDEMSLIFQSRTEDTIKQLENTLVFLKNLLANYTQLKK